MRRKTLGWIIFIVGYILLCWWARGHQAKDIQAYITQEADALTEQLDASSPSIDIESTVSGRDIHLSGVAPTDDIENIKDQYMALRGRRVVTTNDINNIEAASPYIFDATKQGADNTISGYAPNQGDVATLAGAFPGAADSNIQIASGSPENWDAAVTAGGAALNALDYGELKIVDTDVTLTGFAGDEAAKSAAESQLAQLPENFSSNSTIDLPEPEPEVEPEPEPVVEPEPAPAPEVSADACGEQVQAILTQNTINFVTGSANLDDQSVAVLDEIAVPVQLCLEQGELVLEIGGHTDADGDEAANQQLSQARAEAVLQALADRGVNITSVTAVGYGETQPIADNDTPEGKATNRRTTFTWQ